MIRCCLLVLVTIAGLATCDAFPAEQAARVRVIGLLFVSAGPEDPIVHAMRRGLGELGYVEGRNFRFEYRGAQGHAERLPRLAKELVSLNVDVIVTGADISTRAAKQATGTIPIVAVLYDRDPVESGLARSYSRPGGNVTGIYMRQPELIAKQLELLKEALPAVSSVAVFWDGLSPQQLEDVKAAAQSLAVPLTFIELGVPYDFPAAFKSAKAANASAVLVLVSPAFYVQRRNIGALAFEHRIPAMTFDHEFTETGGLMSYATDISDNYFRVAHFIDHLFKGAVPSELPFDQNAKFNMAVNLRTARALRITLPQSILVRADEVFR